MKQILYIVILLTVFCLTALSQEPKVVAEPIGKPFIVSGEQLENLEVPASMDRFGKIDNSQMKARLDLFTSLISSKNKTVEFVIQLKGETKQSVSKNMEFVYTYLTGKKKIEPARISFAVAPEGEEATEFWLIPNKNISIPTCKDCPIIQAEDEESLKDYFQPKKSKN